MSNTLGILEVTLAQISDATHQVNDATQFGTEPLDGGVDLPVIKQARSWAYEPMVVRVTDHPADGGGTDSAEDMALFVSARHGEAWIMTGHQVEYLRHSGALVIADTEAYSVIFPNFDYSTFA